jgi:hypothetical protein
MESSFGQLPDPFGDRAVKDMRPPPNRPITQEKLFPYSGKRNADGKALTPTNQTG